MQRTLTISHMLVRITGVLLLILGLLIWAENARGLVLIHMLLGLVMVVSLWVMAAVSSRLGTPIGLAGGMAVVGVLVLWLGLQQTSLMLDSSHWVIQAVHLLLGMAAIALAEVVGGRLRRARVARAA